MNLDKISCILQDECNLEPGPVLIVGVSGGPDSLSLLYVLLELDYQVLPVHLDHMLRPGSDLEAEGLKSMLAKDNIRLISGRENAGQYARIHHMSVEEAAREIRYRFLFDQANLHKAQAVAVGHTADDQVETVLMHILRGSGITGLQGMRTCQNSNPWDPEIPLIRPLLSTWREDIVAYCEKRRLSPIEDLSNYDTTIFRNRLRFDLIPELERSYNPQAKKAIWRLSQTLQSDAEIIQTATADAWEDVCLEQKNTFIRFDVELLREKYDGIQRNLIRQAIQYLSDDPDNAGYENVERAYRFISDPEKLEAVLGGGIILMLMNGEIIFFKEESEDWLKRFPQISGAQKLPLDGEIYLGNQWWLKCRKTTITNPVQLNAIKTDPFSALGSLEAVSLPLMVRSPEPGDRFFPYGMDGHSIKLSDFFINEKLPRRTRKKFPLVCSNNEIVWIPGFRLAHPYRVTKGTEEVVHLRLERRANKN